MGRKRDNEVVENIEIKRFRMEYKERTHEKGTPLLKRLCKHGFNMGYLV